MLSQIDICFVLLGILLGLVEQSNGQVKISQAQFNAAVTNNGFPTPKPSAYNGFKKYLSKALITTNLEAAQYLAQIIHESGGLQTTREGGCPTASSCQERYPVNKEWKTECQGSNRPTGIGYFGRGYLQLTWCSNYIQASKALFNNDSLKTNPEQVATNDDLSWRVSAWYWADKVHNVIRGVTPQFGRTTKAINGPDEECGPSGKNKDKSLQRYKYYVKVFNAFKVTGTPNESGCYN